MARFRTRSKVSQTVKVGPFSFRLKKPRGRGRLQGSVGTRIGRRGPLGRVRGWGKSKRRWR